MAGIDPYASAAQQYWRAGWANPIPVRDKGNPVSGYTGYDGRNVSWPDIQAWIDGEEAGWNIALRLPGDIIGIDVDAYDEKCGAASLALAENNLGRLPPAPYSTSRAPFSGSGIRFFRVPADSNLRGAEKRFRERFGDHVDILRRNHRYAVVWPSVHPETGTTYQWYGQWGEAVDVPRPSDLPELPAPWVDFLIAPVEGEERSSHKTMPRSEPSVWDLPRQFTRAQAVEFVRPHMEALRAAPTGTINNRLNDAAVVLGHFVPAVWARTEAERFLTEVLSQTAYDGKTWRAEATIASGLNAQGWRAELLSDADEPVMGQPSRDEALDREVARLHLLADAKERVTAERHARHWRQPRAFGSLADELQLPEDPVTWRLKGLLGAGHNAVLVAGRKAGKTTMVNELVRSYVDGEAFLDRFAVEPADAAVAVFNYEVDERQYRRWLREVGIVNTDRVHVLHLRGHALPLRNDRVRAWVAAWLRDRGVGLWVVDPYSRAYIGSLDNGNDEAQVSGFLDTLDVVKAEAGVGELVMPVHTPKARVDTGEESAIGSQRLEAWPDSMWYLTRDLESGLRFLRAEGRDVDVPEEQLTYDGVRRRLTLGGWDRRTLRNRVEVDAVVQHIQEHPGCTQNDIQSAMGWGAARTKKAIESGMAVRAIRTESMPGQPRGRFHWAN